MKISTRIIISLVISLVIVGGALISLAYNSMQKESAIFLGQLESVKYDSKKEELKNEMLIVQGSIYGLYKSLKEKESSEDEIKEAIKSELRDVRFFDDKSGYIFIYEYDGTNVLFPISPALEGKNLNHLKDKNGVYVIQDLIKRAKEGGGIVEYLWPKVANGEPQKKFSYALSFEPYNWMIGTGVYVDNVEQDIAILKEKTNKEINSQIVFFTMIALLLIVVNIIANYIIVRFYITNPLTNLIDRTNNLSSGDGDLTRKLAIVGNDEIAEASKGINKFIEKVRILISDAKNLSNENSSISHELSTTSLEVGKLVEESTSIVNHTTKSANNVRVEMSTGIEEAKASKQEMLSANIHLQEANKTILQLTEDIQDTAHVEVELAHKI